MRGKHEDKGTNPQHPGECGGSPAISGLERQKQRISPLGASYLSRLTESLSRL